MSDASDSNYESSDESSDSDTGASVKNPTPHTKTIRAVPPYGANLESTRNGGIYDFTINYNIRHKLMNIL